MKAIDKVSLKALYTLATISRHKSLKKVADQLCVTPSAISHQINRLEKVLGVKLLFKQGKQVMLTDDAVRFASDLNGCFNDIESSLQNLLHTEKRIIHIGVESAFAVNRFTSALGVWLEKNLNLDIRLRMLHCEDDIADLNLDMALSNNYIHSRYITEYIAHHRYIPVCNKELYGNIAKQSFSQILSSQTLLDIENINCWQFWFQKNQIDFREVQTVQYYSHTLLLFQAALSGQGVALLEYSLIKEQIENGLLVALCDDVLIPEEIGYYFSYKKEQELETYIPLIRDLIFHLVMKDDECIVLK